MPRRWYAIGRRFEELREEGAAYDGARRIIAAEFAMSETVVQGTLKFYRDAMEAVEDATSD